MTTLAVVIDWSGAEVRADLLTDSERAWARRFPSWRRGEWAMGRLTAHVALLLRGGPATRHWDVLPDRDGAPRVSGRWTLSLSHKDSLAACAVHEEPAGLGIDVESDDAQVVDRVLAPAEPLPPAGEATVVWSCKEAAYKACRGEPPRLRDYQVVLSDRGISVHPVGAAVGLRAWCTRSHGAVVAVVSSSVRPPRHLTLDGTQAIALLEGESS